MDLKHKKILVTGADGFIGSHLTETLVRRGYDVRAFVFYNSFNSWGWLEESPAEIKSALEVFAGDVRDPHGVKTAMKGCDVVMHLAALIGIPYSYHSPDSYVDTNIKGTLNILQVARELGVSRILHTSTSEVYGTAQFVPISEDHPLHPQSPYAATKVAADQLALSFYYSFGMPVSIVRPFNTYGPRQSARAVIPTIIAQLAAGRSKIKLGALTPTRDLTFVSDTVEGFIAAAQSDKVMGEVVNLGTQFEISIGDLARLIMEGMDIHAAIECDPQRMRPANSEVERLLADNSKAQKLMDWNPRFLGREGLKAGLSQTIGWFTESNRLAQYKAEICNI